MAEKVLTDRKRCTGCFACADVCSRKAIQMEHDKAGFVNPKVNPKRCVECGECSRVCPALQKDETITEYKTRYFGVKNNDITARAGSSSGGVFPMLAKQVLKSDGVVVAATMDAGGHVKHIVVNTEAEMVKTTKTKYVPSDMTGIYKTVRTTLEQGKRVLFVGTPCQVEAMRRFVGKYRENLILVDLICYGVPSLGIWEKYVKLLEKKYNGTFESFSFRDKRKQDNGHTAAVTIDGVEHAYSLYKDPYCTSYFRNINIRESCLQCRFAGTERNSDLTLGDFWGIEIIHPEYEDGMGTSVVMAHTGQGMDLLQSVLSDATYFECSREDILQPRLIEPTAGNAKRKKYLRLYSILPFKVWLKLVTR